MPETNCGFEDIPDGASGAQLLLHWGPTLMVNIGFDSDWDFSSPTGVPAHSIENVNALVDTGATESCIDDLLATQLNLPIFDIRPVSGTSGQHDVKMYLAQIHIPSLNYTIYGAFAGVHLSAGGQVHKALIGRTFLTHFKMVYEGTTGIVKLILD